MQSSPLDGLDDPAAAPLAAIEPGATGSSMAASPARKGADRPTELLRDLFGYPAFRGHQRAIIDAALAGRDTLVLMPTGGGKSLCYQIPALVREGTGLVVSPLIALMEDQVRALCELGIEAAFLNSSLSGREQHDVIERLQSGALDLLYIAPERLMMPQTQEVFREARLSIVAIDEAHCVSQWGHDFRPEYLQLAALKDLFPGVPRMALTATATPPTRAEIVERLALDDPACFVAGFDRPNIRYSVKAKTDARKQLAKFLEDHRGEAGIVYCLTRKRVEQTAEWLQAQGFDALPYHAGLDAATREEHLLRFLTDDAVVIVATIAFGMGIDKPDVRFVAHFDLPKSIESYYQETGRAGRDGEPADAWMVYGLADVVQLRQLVDSSDASEDHKRHERQKLDALLGWCEVTDCRRRSLLAYFGDDSSSSVGAASGRDLPCNNCDNCLSPPATWDGTEAAQKLLSAVYRTHQRFGAAHIVDVLLGNATDKVTHNRHDQLSVFGIGTERSAHAWRSVIRQLVVRGYLRADQERYGALALTAASRPLLRGEVSVQFREDVMAPVGRRKSVRAATAMGTTLTKETLNEEQRAQWEKLRDLRRRIAAEQGVPPYVIFHDATLLAMVEHRPRSEEEMLGLSGVGKAKIEKYGARFVEALNMQHTERG